MKKALLCMIFLLMFTLPASAADQYQWIHYDGITDYFFDTQSIKFERDSNNKTVNTSIIDVWITKVYNQNEVNKGLEILKEAGISTDRWSKLSYSISNTLINRKEYQIKRINDIYYDTDGKIILRSYNSYAAWDPIIPGSNEDLFEKVLSNYTSQNRDKVYNRTKYFWFSSFPSLSASPPSPPQRRN